MHSGNVQVEHKYGFELERVLNISVKPWPEAQLIGSLSSAPEDC